jgi:hypothetical protein
MGQGFRSTHAIPMRIRGDIMGLMAPLSITPRPRNESDARIAHSRADIAAFGVVQKRTFRQPRAISEQSHLALDTRIFIEQAISILSDRFYRQGDRARHFPRLRPETWCPA